MHELKRSQSETELASGVSPARLPRWQAVVEVLLLLAIFFVYAGDLPPKVNEAHYLVKAKNFWNPDWCQRDLFAASGKAHTTFYTLFGWPTLWFSLETTAWLGRCVGWLLLAFGLHRLCWNLLQRRYVSLSVALVWIASIEYGNLAGEWVIGGIEAKVPAYGLILLALSELAARRWSRVWIYLGIASAFHVLSGGWSVIAASITWWFTERRREGGRPFFSIGLFVGGFIALFGLVPALALSMGANAEDATVAARIYSYYRIRHHLLPADFFFSWYARHIVLLVLVFFLAHRYWNVDASMQRVGWFTIGAVMIAAVGLLVGMLPGYAPDLAARLLRYYWFRLSDAVVPLMLALLVGKTLIDEARWPSRIGLAAALIAMALVGVSVYRRSHLGVPPSVSNDLLGRDAGAPASQQRAVYKDWMTVCRWVRTSTTADEVFLTPRHQQTFKWYAGRAEVVNWKDVPQDAASLRAWHERFQEIFPRRLGHVRVTIQYSLLREYRRRYGVRFLVVDRRVTGDRLPLVKVYPSDGESNQTYAVYELPSD